MNLLTNSRNNMNYQIFNSKKELRNVMGVFNKTSVLQLIYNRRSKSFREHYVSFDKIEKNCLYTTSISIRVNSDIEVLPKISISLALTLIEILVVYKPFFSILSNET